MTTEGKVLRPSGKITVLLVALPVFLLIVAWVAQALGNRWGFLFFAIFALIQILFVLQHLVSRIALLPDRLILRSILGRRSILKERVESVTWAKGVGVRVIMKDQSIIRVPDLGNAPGVSNSIRAWLRHEDNAA